MLGSTEENAASPTGSSIGQGCFKGTVPDKANGFGNETVLVTLRKAPSEERAVLMSHSYQGPEQGIKKRRKQTAGERRE